MDKVLRPDRFDVEPNDEKATKQWRHWYQTFGNFLRSIDGQNQNLNKLDVLTNFVSPEVYELFCDAQSRSTPTSGPPPKVSTRAPAHRSYHFRGVKLKSCIKKIHHNLYISKQANVRIKHTDTEGASHKKFGTDARVQ